MQYKYVFFIISLLLTTGLQANSDKNSKTLVINGVEHSIDKAEYELYVKGFNDFALGLSTCSDREIGIEHPLNKRRSLLTVTKQGNLCHVTYYRDLLWLYDCRLNTQDRTELSNAILSWKQNMSGMGDFPPELQKILFNKEICDAKRRY